MQGMICLGCELWKENEKLREENAELRRQVAELELHVNKLRQRISFYERIKAPLPRKRKFIGQKSFKRYVTSTHK